MALKNCKECGAMISASAGRCPQCGARHDYGGYAWLLVIVIAIAVIAVTFQCGK